MAEFFKKLMGNASDPVPAANYKVEGRMGVIGTIEVSPGKAFKVVREDILQKGLSRKGPKRAA